MSRQRRIKAGDFLIEKRYPKNNNDFYCYYVLKVYKNQYWRGMTLHHGDGGFPGRQFRCDTLIWESDSSFYRKFHE